MKISVSYFLVSVQICPKRVSSTNTKYWVFCSHCYCGSRRTNSGRHKALNFGTNWSHARCMAQCH